MGKSERKLSKKWKRTIMFVLILIAIWLGGDLAYSLTVRWRVGQWESLQTWTEDDVRKGCETFELGAGEHAVLFVHGINDSPRVFDNMASTFAESGYFVRSVRLPGFGERVQNQTKYDAQDWLDTVSLEIDALNETHQSVYVIAHSLGCAVLINHLLDDPEGVDRVALIAPAIDVSRNRSPALSPQSWHQVGNALLLFTRVTESPFGLDTQDESARDYKWRCPFVTRRFVDELFQLVDSNRQQIENLKTPFALVTAKHDQVIDSDAAKRVYERLATSDHQLILAENSGHSIPLDNDWRHVTDELIDYFDDSRSTSNSEVD